MPINKIIFTYIVKDGLADETRELLQQPKYEVKAHIYNNYVLPLSMDPTKYGNKIAIEQLDADTIRHVYRNETHIFTIDSVNNGNINQVNIEGASGINFVDTKLSDNSFRRVIGKNVIYIKDGTPKER